MGGVDVTITFDAYIADRLRALGDARRRSLEALVYEALERFLEEEEGYEKSKADEESYHRGRVTHIASIPCDKMCSGCLARISLPLAHGIHPMLQFF